MIFCAIFLLSVAKLIGVRLCVHEKGGSAA